MPRGFPVVPETRALVIELMGKDMTRNAIAREVGVAGAYVTRVAGEIGHSFDRSKSEVAVRARQIDMAEMRELLAKASLDEAMQALEEMHSPAVMVQFEPGHEVTEYNEDGVAVKRSHEAGSFREHILDEPTFSDKRNLATIFGIMVTKANELSRASEIQGSAEAVSFIDGMADAIAAVRAKLTEEPGADPTVEPTNVSRDKMLEEFGDAPTGEIESQ